MVGLGQFVHIGLIDIQGASDPQKALARSTNKKERKKPRSDLPPVRDFVKSVKSLQRMKVRYRRKLVCLRDCDPEWGRRLRLARYTIAYPGGGAYSPFRDKK